MSKAFYFIMIFALFISLVICFFCRVGKLNKNGVRIQYAAKKGSQCKITTNNRILTENYVDRVGNYVGGAMGSLLEDLKGARVLSRQIKLAKLKLFLKGCQLCSQK